MCESRHGGETRGVAALRVVADDVSLGLKRLTVLALVADQTAQHARLRETQQTSRASCVRTCVCLHDARAALRRLGGRHAGGLAAAT